MSSNPLSQGGNNMNPLMNNNNSQNTLGGMFVSGQNSNIFGQNQGSGSSQSNINNKDLFVARK